MIDFKLLREYLDMLKEYGIEPKEYSIPSVFEPLPLKIKEDEECIQFPS